MQEDIINSYVRDVFKKYYQTGLLYSHFMMTQGHKIGGHDMKIFLHVPIISWDVIFMFVRACPFMIFKGF